ncbi:MAG TPA: DUF6186 family protein [Actinomycetota bacterium]|nr:DUF6186 family protein [Actinomycetota bacterium]
MAARVITEVGFAAFFVIGIVLQLLAMRPGSRVPTLGAVITRAMRTRSGRVGIIAGWVWLGLHFFAR